MMEPRKLLWQSTRDLYKLSSVVRKSIDSSMECIDQNCPTSGLKMRSSYVTEGLMKKALKTLENPSSHDPMLIINFSAQKVEVTMVYILGPKSRHLMIVDKSELRDCYKYLESAKDFLGHIAENCYKITENYSHCFGLSTAGKTVLCTILSHFPTTQTSLTNAKIENFTNGFFLADCEGKDLVRMLNEQLESKRDSNAFKINCTNMLSFGVSTMAGDCMAENDPNIVVSSSQGSSNISFIESLPGFDDLPGPVMIVNTEISKFGSCDGLMERDVLKRFLDSSIDGYYDGKGDDGDVNKIQSDLYGQFISSYQMRKALIKFLQMKVPDFRNRFLWMNFAALFREEHISDLLEFVETGSNANSCLIQVYHDLDDDTRQEMAILCQTMRDRSANMLAAMTFGTMKRAAQKRCYKTKKLMTVNLAGKTMLNMHGYKHKFEATLGQLKHFDAKVRGVDLKMNFETQSLPESSHVYGAVGISKYVGSRE